MAVTEQSRALAALTVEREISASPDAVYEAFTNPDIGRRWMGPGEVRCLAYECDAVVGGRYRIHMRSEQGDHVAFGEYLELVPGRKLVYTWSWEDGHVENSRITVRLRPLGAKTQVQISHELLPDPAAAESHTEGWTGCLVKLQALFQQA